MERLRLWTKIEKRYLPEYAWESDLLTFWRERILMVICLTGVVFGPFSLIPSLTLSYMERRWDIFFLGIFAYSSAVVVIIYRNQPLRFKVWLTYCVFYLLGLGLLLNLGPFGAGYIWLFGSSIMAASMIGFRASIFALGLNFFTLTILGILQSFDLLTWTSETNFTVKIWVVMVVNFMLVDALVTFIVAVLFSGLKRALVTEKKISDDLRKLETRFRLIVENLPVMIVGFHAGDELTLWNRECQRVTGYTAEEAAQNPDEVLVLVREENAGRQTMSEWLKAEGNFHDQERAVKCRDGSNRIISWSNVSDIVSIQGLDYWAVGLDVTDKKAAEEELLNASYKNTMIFENATEGIMVIQGGLFKYFNRKTAKLIGYDSKELFSMADVSFIEWVHPEDRELVVNRYFKRQKGDDVPSEYQIRILRKGGNPIWVEISSTIIEWEGEPATLTFMTDITDRKRAEDLLRESERRFKEMASLLPTVIVELDPNGRVTYSNLAGFNMFGYQPEHIKGGLYISDFIDEEELPRIMDIFNRVIQKGESSAGSEYTLVTRDGKRITCFAQVRPMVLNGEIKGARASLMDITEAKRARMDLEASEEKYRTILANIEEGYYEASLSGDITFFNQSLAKILGYSNDEVGGLNYQKIMDEDTIREAYRVFVDVYETGKPAKAVDWVVLRKDGSACIVETSVSPIVNASGKIIGFRGVARDVTEKKALQEARRKSIEAEAANQAKTDFLARMSHEIRTPLNAIVGMAELAVAEDLNERLEKIIEIINNESSALMGLVNQILDFSKIEAEKLELEFIPFELAYLLEDISDGVAIQAHKKDLEFILHISPNVPTRLIGDPGRIRQVLINLLSNAVKFTTRGEVYLKVEALNLTEKKARLQFSIKDTGIGISEEKQKEIFEPFTQADGSTTRQYGGTGLGTTISKKLVELMGGELILESREGVGSTFRFSAEFKRQEEKESAVTLPIADLVNKRIMVADDNLTYRHVLASYLTSWGCRAIEATTLDDALAKLEAAKEEDDPVDLLLADLEHFHLDDAELTKTVKEVPELEKTPIVVLAGVGRMGDGIRYRDIGVQGYLAKPIRRDDLLHVIRLALGQTEYDGSEYKGRLYTKHSVPEMERNRVKILLVEDYPTNQLIATEHLVTAGYRVELAQNGREAVEMFQRRRYDLILMDIQMPVMDGYEATLKIREIEARIQDHSENDSPAARIPIIAMTAHAFRGYRQKCIDAGMVDYLTKPLLREELLDVVNRWANKATLHPNGTLLERKDEQAPTQAWKIQPDGDILELLTASDAEEPPIDLPTVIEEFMGKEELVKEVIARFLESVKMQIIKMREAIVEGDHDVIRSEAHAIKGGAANLTANRLSSVAKELEQDAREGQSERYPALLDHLADELEHLELHLRGVGAI